MGGSGTLHEEHEGEEGEAEDAEEPVDVVKGQHVGLALEFAVEQGLGLFGCGDHVGAAGMQQSCQTVNGALVLQVQRRMIFDEAHLVSLGEADLPGGD